MNFFKPRGGIPIGQNGVSPLCRVALAVGLFCLLAMLPTLPASAQEKGTTWAVVVGLNYNWSPGNALRFTLSDARRFQSFLHLPEGHAVFLTDEETEEASSRATRAHIEQAIRGMAAKAGPNDTFWFYFSGHGEFLPASESSFLIPADIKSLTSESGVSVRALRALLANPAVCRAHTKILVLDACESGSSKRWKEVADAPPSQIFEPLPGVITLAAARPDRSAYETEQSPVDGGIFTYYLCCGLAGAGTPAGQPVTLKTLKPYVIDNVDRLCSKLGHQPQEPVFLAPSGESDSGLPNVAVGAHDARALTQLQPAQAAQASKIDERPQFEPGAILVVETGDAALRESAQTMLEQALGDKQIRLYSSEIAPEQLRAMRDPKRTDAGLTEARRLSARLLLRVRVTTTVSPSEVIADASIVRVVLHVEVTDVYNAVKAAADIEEGPSPSGSGGLGGRRAN